MMLHNAQRSKISAGGLKWFRKWDFIRKLDGKFPDFLFCEPACISHERTENSIKFSLEAGHIKDVKELATSTPSAHQWCRALVFDHGRGFKNVCSKMKNGQEYNMVQHIRRHALTGQNKMPLFLYLFELHIYNIM